jgi:hypothetical protein
MQNKYIGIYVDKELEDKNNYKIGTILSIYSNLNEWIEQYGEIDTIVLARKNYTVYNFSMLKSIEIRLIRQRFLLQKCLFRKKISDIDLLTDVNLPIDHIILFIGKNSSYSNILSKIISQNILFSLYLI